MEELYIPVIKERHEIYKIAKKLHIDDVERGDFTMHGMCDLLKDAYQSRFSTMCRPSTVDFPNIFPEFHEIGQNLGKSYSQYWWTTRDMKDKNRLNAFNKLINQTKDE